MLNGCDDIFLDMLSQSTATGLLRTATPTDVEERRNLWQGQGRVVACPRNTTEVCQIIRACNSGRIGVVPLGGGTGLVGGQTMPEGPLPLLLSLERMATIRDVYARENILIVEAGMTLANVQLAAKNIERIFPLSLASQGSAQIGGNLATNAGGLNVLRYGNMRDLCLGVEAVLPDGSILNGLKRLHKDNSGYDLRHLLIGSEGTLGIITAASLKLAAPPYHKATALLTTPSPSAALKLFSIAQNEFSEMISAFELIGRMGYDFLNETIPEIHLPFSPFPDWSILIELGLPKALHPQEALSRLYQTGQKEGLILEGITANSEKQRDMLWHMRESLPEANRKIGAVSHHDISLPLSTIPYFISEAETALAKVGNWRINCFGHLGDGNLHYNIFPPKGHPHHDHSHLRPHIKECIHSMVNRMGGSISAEHGIGRLKAADLQKYGDPTKLTTMRMIKKALDPNGIMNPGALITLP